jgi:uncharacterized Zn ribbon protein
MSDLWSHCPMCTGSQTVVVDEAQELFTCKDCCNEWTGNYNHYEYEPELNPER